MSTQDNLSVNDFLTALNINFERDKKAAPSEQDFPDGNRVALIAPPAAGKTTTVSGLFMRANKKVGETLHTDAPFKCRMLEGGSNIHQDVSDLSDGIFPAKTQTYLGFRSSPGLLLEQLKYAAVSIPFTGKFFNRTDLRPRKEMWHKMLRISINDLPGETLSQVMWQVRAKTGPQQQIIRDTIGNAIQEMRSCQAFIFILKASLARGLGLPLETERDPTVSRDPDVNLVRMLEDIVNYKAKHGEQIKAAYIVISAWDKLQPRAEKMGFDLFAKDLVKRQTDLEKFVEKCFPQFFGTLHSSGIKNINYYPTFFQTETNEKCEELLFDDTLEYRAPDGSIGVKNIKRPHIMVKDIYDPNTRSIWDNVRSISYSEESYDQLLNDVMQLATVSKK
jgi:hypothetical protein